MVSAPHIIHLLQLFAAAHHHVTILYLWAARSDESEMRYWESLVRTLGIAFVPLTIPWDAECAESDADGLRCTRLAAKAAI